MLVVRCLQERKQHFTIPEEQMSKSEFMMQNVERAQASLTWRHAKVRCWKLPKPYPKWDGAEKYDSISGVEDLQAGF